MLKIEVEPLKLHLEDPFKLSYGATSIRENVLVHLTDGQYHGVGEAAVVPYYGETPQRIIDYVSQPNLPTLLENWAQNLNDAIDMLPSDGSMAARAALDIALHDLWGQHQGQPLYQLWGLNPQACPQNSFTIAMSEDEVAYKTKLQNAAHYPLIKLKLGSGAIDHDLRLVELARQTLTARLCVDANAAWSVAESLQIIPQLAELGVIFIEQPLAKENLAGWHSLKAQLPPHMPPLIADESVQGLESLAVLAGRVDGVNIKLAKCGGLWVARQMIAAARQWGMQVMLGCMIESSVAVTAAAHLAPLADYVDLDGNLLITNDPYAGVKSVAGQLILPQGAGLGVARRDL